MIWTPANCKGKILVDNFNTPIPYVKSFDDETFEVEIYLYDKDSCQLVNNEWKIGEDGISATRDIVVFKGTVKGAKLIDVKKDIDQEERV